MTNCSSVATMTLSVRVYGTSWYNHERQNFAMVGYGIVTPQNVVKMRPTKGLNRAAVYEMMNNEKKQMPDKAHLDIR